MYDNFIYKYIIHNIYSLFTEYILHLGKKTVPCYRHLYSPQGSTRDDLWIYLQWLLGPLTGSLPRALWVVWGRTHSQER